MSFHTIDLSNGKEHQVEEAVLQRLPAHPKPTMRVSNRMSAGHKRKSRALALPLALSSISSNWDAEHNAGVALHNKRRRTMDSEDCPTQMLTGETLDIASAELRVGRLTTLADSAESRFQRQGVVKEIDLAIECRAQLPSLTPEKRSSRPKHVAALNTTLQHRSKHADSLAAIEKTIKCLSQALLFAPNGHEGKPIWLEKLERCHLCRFVGLGELADLDKAIEYGSQVVLLTPSWHALKPRRLSNLGNSHLRRFRLFGEPTDADQAIKYLTEAGLIDPGRRACKPDWLFHLGSSYRSRFDRLGGLVDIIKAIEYISQAVALSPDGHASKPGRLNDLGISYLSRFSYLKEHADLDKAVDSLTQAVQLTSNGHEDRPMCLANLGASFQSRFEHLGKLADVNKAIEHLTQAVTLTPDGHASKLGRLNNLGVLYRSRFSCLKKLADLDKSIDFLTQAVLLTSNEREDRPMCLANLGASFQSRFEHLGKLADVNKAIEYQTQAVLLTSTRDTHVHYPLYLNQLGTSYQSRFRTLGQPTDLNKAIEYYTEATLLTPDGHAAKPGSLSNLGDMFYSQLAPLGKLEDMNKAIKYLTQAVILTPGGHASKPGRLHNLAASHQYRFGRLGNLLDIELSRLFFRSAAQLAVTDPEIQIKCAHGWAKCLSQLGLSPKSAYERCMELIPHIIGFEASISQRYSLLTNVSDLATEAAAWAISVKAYDLALEWLEEGRSIVWNHILQLRAFLDDSSTPTLAKWLSVLESADSRQAIPAPFIHTSSHTDGETQHRYHLAGKWEQPLGQTCKIPRSSKLMRPRKAGQLKLSATKGPVVLINAHSTRCDALIIFPRCNNIAHLPLESFSLAKLDMVRVQLDSLIGYQRNILGRLQPRKSVPNSEVIYKSILVTLWTSVVKPVLDFLAYTDKLSVDDLPHVTWCTTGALSFLPLHAAGYHDGSQPNAFDLVVSSYTPSLGALLTASTPATNPYFGVLAVGQQHARGSRPLPHTVHELATIKKCVGATHIQQLDGGNATVEAVLEAMDKHSWVHIACHTTQDPNNPFNSGFRLHNGSLTLKMITKRSFKNKGLAFLSACMTATGAKKFSGEAVHLAAGMLIAGYPSVIATMWQIRDDDGPQIAQGVYADLVKDGKLDHTQAARALHKAVAGLREKIGHDSFRRWVPFIHIGV